MGRTLHRNTRQRRVIVEELMRHPTHPTAAQLYEATRRRLPRISLGTVYRNLDLLSRTGAIRKLAAPDGVARFDGNVEPHHHVVCERCGALADVWGLPAELWPAGLVETAGYDIVAVRLELIGVCPDCRDGSAKEKNPSDETEGVQGH